MLLVNIIITKLLIIKIKNKLKFIIIISKIIIYQIIYQIICQILYQIIYQIII